ncbi:MAG: hypothetical protein H6510_02265 [Acidobacteria bacterium]|nr:hypothetical protein [Acidobacteriota bacterium]MCB9396618.1 hypothetical protein [Acidobacteriota bacterium]
MQTISIGKDEDQVLRIEISDAEKETFSGVCDWEIVRDQRSSAIVEAQFSVTLCNSKGVKALELKGSKQFKLKGFFTDLVLRQRIGKIIQETLFEELKALNNSAGTNAG